jgi:hypothetical protein
MSAEAWRSSARNELVKAVFELCQRRIEEFQRSRPPMPLVALHAEGFGPGPEAAAEADERVQEVVWLIHEAQAQRGMLVRRLTGPSQLDGQGEQPVASPEEAAYPLTIAMLKLLVQQPWTNQRRSQYRRFSFPRSQLVLAIEQAVDAVTPPAVGTSAGRRPGGGEADAGGNSGLEQEEFEQRLIGELKRRRWRYRPTPTEAGAGADGSPMARVWSALRDFSRQSRDTAGPLGAMLLVAVGAVLSQVGGQQAGVITGALITGVLLSVLVTRLAPSPLIFRASGQWFATTTSLAAYATPRMYARWSRWRYGDSWEVMEDRAKAVGHRILAARRSGGDRQERAKARQFHRELLAIALLEDLRDNFRTRTLDLRGHKRTMPPVVSLPNATRANGGQLLLRTLSDVRSRRSEQDPLMVVAGIPAAEADDFWSSGQFPGPLPNEPEEGGPSPDALYDDWKLDLSVGQSPRLSNLAWVLRIPLSAAELAERRSQTVTVTRVRSTWVRQIWSWRALIAVLTGALIAGTLWNQHQAAKYCRADVLTANTDSVWEPTPQGGRECVGVATGSVRFSLPAKDDKATLEGLGAGITRYDVENAIRQQNSAYPGRPYVTIVYAGPLTTDVSETGRAPKGLEEMTGVYLRQAYVNARSAVKLRVLLANGGDDMRHEDVMVGRIIRLARRDPSVVGVVGLGRDTTYSGDSAGRLQRADLPIVNTTNSGTYLAKQYANYFGLAATDAEQAEVMATIAKRTAGPPRSRSAVVLSRNTDQNDYDRYTLEQKTYGKRMLQKAGFRLVADQTYSLSGPGGSPDLRAPVTSICTQRPVPTAMYFAGRVEDVPSLMSQLSTSGCANHRITVFTGDDLSKAGFDQQTNTLSPGITLYYVSLAPIDKGSGIAEVAATAEQQFPLLRPGGKFPAPSGEPYDDRLFASGQIALAWDATAALYQAASWPSPAQRDRVQTSAETWANLRGLTLASMATGTVTFEGTAPYRSQQVHGLNILRVRRGNDGQGPNETKIICGLPAGSGQPITDLTCKP